MAPTKLSTMIKKGHELFEAANYVEAKDIFANLYEKYPADKEVQNYYGLVLFKLGLHSEAMGLYKKMLEKVPNFPALHLNLGIIYFKEGLLDLAFEEFIKTVKFAPKNKKAKNYIGLIHMKKGNLEEAYDIFTETGSKKMLKEVTALLKKAEKNAPAIPLSVKKNSPKKPEVKKELKRQPPPPIIKEVPKDTPKGVPTLAFISSELNRNAFKSSSESEFMDTYKGLLRYKIKDNMFTRLSLLESFSGSLDFKGVYRIVSKKQTNTLLGNAGDPIYNVYGKGSLILSLGKRELLTFNMKKETFYVKEDCLLGFDNGIKYENTSKKFAESFELVKLSGSGSVALLTKDKPFTQLINAENPLAIKLEYIIGWYGKLKTRIVDSEERLFKRREDSKWVTFKGDGYVFCTAKD